MNDWTNVTVRYAGLTNEIRKANPRWHQKEVDGFLAFWTVESPTVPADFGVSNFDELLDKLFRKLRSADSEVFWMNKHSSEWSKIRYPDIVAALNAAGFEVIVFDRSIVGLYLVNCRTREGVNDIR